MLIINYILLKIDPVCNWYELLCIKSVSCLWTRKRLCLLFWKSETGRALPNAMNLTSRRLNANRKTLIEDYYDTDDAKQSLNCTTFELILRKPQTNSCIFHVLYMYAYVFLVCAFTFCRHRSTLFKFRNKY